MLIPCQTINTEVDLTKKIPFECINLNTAIQKYMTK